MHQQNPETGKPQFSRSWSLRKEEPSAPLIPPQREGEENPRRIPALLVLEIAVLEGLAHADPRVHAWPTRKSVPCSALSFRTCGGAYVFFGPLLSEGASSYTSRQTNMTER